MMLGGTSERSISCHLTNNRRFLALAFALRHARTKVGVGIRRTVSAPNAKKSFTASQQQIAVAAIGTVVAHYGSRGAPNVDGKAGRRPWPDAGFEAEMKRIVKTEHIAESFSLTPTRTGMERR